MRVRCTRELRTEHGRTFPVGSIFMIREASKVEQGTRKYWARPADLCLEAEEFLKGYRQAEAEGTLDNALGNLKKMDELMNPLWLERKDFDRVHSSPFGGLGGVLVNFQTGEFFNAPKASPSGRTLVLGGTHEAKSFLWGKWPEDWFEKLTKALEKNKRAALELGQVWDVVSPVVGEDGEFQAGPELFGTYEPEHPDAIPELWTLSEIASTVWRSFKDMDDCIEDVHAWHAPRECAADVCRKKKEELQEFFQFIGLTYEEFCDEVADRTSPKWLFDHLASSIA